MVTKYFFAMLFYLSVCNSLLSQEKYFPLHDGNRWMYHSYLEDSSGNPIIDSTFTISILNSSSQYHIFDRYFLYFATLPLADSSLFNVEGSKVMRHIKGRDMLWYDFSADESDSWVIPVKDDKFVPPDTIDIEATLISKHDIFVLGQDTLKKCIRFSFRLTKFLPHSNYWEELFAPNIGFVEGIFSTDGWHSTRLIGAIINEKPVSVNYQEKSEIKPKKIFLEQNYPNPFNSGTRIVYEILNGETAKIQLKVYSLVGQEIRTLVEKSQLPGLYEVVWDGKDNNGNTMPSGIYIYSLQVGKIKKVNKAILIK